MGHVVTGMDPHQRPATIESIDDRGKVLFQGWLGTDRDGYRAMLAAGRNYPARFAARERLQATDGPAPGRPSSANSPSPTTWPPAASL